MGAILVRGVSNQLLSPLGLLTNGTWKHLAIRYSPTTNMLSLLVNGVLNTQVAQTATPFNWSGSNLTVVGYGGSSSVALSGNYDDYRVYGYARPDADILADYTMTPERPRDDRPQQRSGQGLLRVQRRGLSTLVRDRHQQRAAE